MTKIEFDRMIETVYILRDDITESEINDDDLNVLLFRLDDLTISIYNAYNNNN